MVKNRMIKVGKRGDFLCRQIERQIEAYTGCLHCDDCAVLRPVYYGLLCQERTEKFVRFAVNVWGIQAEGKMEPELAAAGVSALAEELGLPIIKRKRYYQSLELVA